MKFFFRWFLFFSIVCCNVAFAGGKVHEVSTLLGAPNREMPFVQSLLKNTVMLSPDSAYGDLTTGVFYFLWKNGAESVQAFEVLKDSGNAVLSDVFIALDATSENSSIVLAP